MNNPPAPKPWIALNTANWYIETANALNAEPTIKIEIAQMNRGLRPNMSLNFPYKGVVMVEVIKYAVVAQAWIDNPFKSSPIVLIAVATIVWSSAAKKRPNINPMSMGTTSLWSKYVFDESLLIEYSLMWHILLYIQSYLIARLRNLILPPTIECFCSYKIFATVCDLLLIYEKKEDCINSFSCHVCSPNSEFQHSSWK